MSGTSVPTIQFTNTGFVAPAESAIVTGLNADNNAAFGGNLNPAAKTPQGQLATSTAAMLGDCYDQETLLFNGVDPAYASGRMQDAIGRIYFLERDPAQSSVLQIACGGLVGVVLPVGALINDPSGEQWLCTEAGIIPPSGTITLSFASMDMGPIPVPATVAIYQSIPGWNTVAVVSGVLGNVVEGRAAFEARRQATVAANGAGFLPAIAGAVAKVPGVIDYYVTENFTGSPVTVGDVTLVANSLYVCVAGGAAAAVAQAIWTKKNPGCNYTGNTSVTVYDTNSGYSPPYPSYTVTFQTPTPAPICMTVSIKNSPQVPSNAAALIQAAIGSAFIGADGGTRARIGSEIFASRYYPGVAMLGSWAQIVSLLIGTNAAPTVDFTASIAVSGAVMTVTAVSSGTLAVGQFVYGIGVMSGQIILAQIGGTAGGIGTYTVSVGQLIASEAMTSVAAVNNDTTMDIDWIPTLAPPDINVILV